MAAISKPFTSVNQTKFAFQNATGALINVAQRIEAINDFIGGFIVGEDATMADSAPKPAQMKFSGIVDTLRTDLLHQNSLVSRLSEGVSEMLSATGANHAPLPSAEEMAKKNVTLEPPVSNEPPRQHLCDITLDLYGIARFGKSHVLEGLHLVLRDLNRVAEFVCGGNGVKGDELGAAFAVPESLTEHLVDYVERLSSLTSQIEYHVARIEDALGAFDECPTTMEGSHTQSVDNRPMTSTNPDHWCQSEMPERTKSAGGFEDRHVIAKPVMPEGL